MKQNIKKLLNDHIINPYADKLNPIISSYPTFYNSASVGYLNNDKQTVIYKNAESDYIILFEDNSELNIINFILKDITAKEKINNKTIIDLLTISDQIKKDVSKIFPIFNTLKWPSGSKGYSIFKDFHNFSNRLIEQYYNDKISLNSAYLLYKSFSSNQIDLIIEILSKGFTFTETNQLAQYLTDIYRKDRLSFENLIKILQLLNDKAHIYNEIYNSRYPLYNRYSEIFENYVRDIKLPKNVSLEYDKSFESTDYFIKIKFNSIESLLPLLSDVSVQMQKHKDNDLFIQENITDD